MLRIARVAVMGAILLLMAAGAAEAQSSGYVPSAACYLLGSCEMGIAPPPSIGSGTVPANAANSPSGSPISDKRTMDEVVATLNQLLSAQPPFIERKLDHTLGASHDWDGDYALRPFSYADVKVESLCILSLMESSGLSYERNPASEYHTDADDVVAPFTAKTYVILTGLKTIYSGREDAELHREVPIIDFTVTPDVYGVYGFDGQQKVPSTFLRFTNAESAATAADALRHAASLCGANIVSSTAP